MNASSPTSRSDTSAELSEGKRTAISLALFVHLFCLALGLLALIRPSRLTSDLLRVTGVYSQLTGVDMNFDYHAAPFYFTHGNELDAHAFINVELPWEVGKATDWASENRNTRHLLLPNPERTDRGSESFRRQANLARYLTYFRYEEMGVPPLLAQTVAARHMDEFNVDSARVAIRRHSVQPLIAFREGSPEDRDPYNGQWYETDYAYQAVFDELSGETILTREASRRQSSPVAQPTGNSP